jgi:hypothetical protein
MPYYVAALSVLIAAGIVLTGQRALRRIDGPAPEPLAEAEAIGVGEAA